MFWMHSEKNNILLFSKKLCFIVFVLFCFVFFFCPHFLKISHFFVRHWRKQSMMAIHYAAKGEFLYSKKRSWWKDDEQWWWECTISNIHMFSLRRITKKKSLARQAGTSRKWENDILLTHTRIWFLPASQIVEKIKRQGKKRHKEIKVSACETS